MNRLDISLGEASQRLKLLRGVGAVKAVYSPGARRGHFTADLELSKFGSVLTKKNFAPASNGNGANPAHGVPPCGDSH